MEADDQPGSLLRIDHWGFRARHNGYNWGTIEDVKELTRAVGGVNESASAEYLLDVEWRDDDPLFVFDDDNATKPQTPTAASTPVQACEEEDPVAPSFESPLRGKAPLLRIYCRMVIKDSFRLH